MQEWYIYFVCGKGVLFREVSSVSNRVVPLYIIIFSPCSLQSVSEVHRARR